MWALEKSTLTHSVPIQDTKKVTRAQLGSDVFLDVIICKCQKIGI